MKGPSRLNTSDLSLADSPGRKFTSALNTHTSVLNTADEPVDASPLQLAAGSDELQRDVGDSRKGSWSSEDESSDGSSASDHESDSGSAGSSSEGVRELHQGKGKTLPGIFFNLVLVPVNVSSPNSHLLLVRQESSNVSRASCISRLPYHLKTLLKFLAR